MVRVLAWLLILICLVAVSKFNNWATSAGSACVLGVLSNFVGLPAKLVGVVRGSDLPSAPIFVLASLVMGLAYTAVAAPFLVLMQIALGGNLLLALAGFYICISVKIISGRFIQIC